MMAKPAPDVANVAASLAATLRPEPSRIRKAFAMHGRYEAGFLFLLLLIFEWLVAGPASLARINPHPFWIPVVLISVQYGSFSGLMAAGAATALSWVAGWPPQSAQEDFYTFSMRVWREPVLWIVGALVIGAIRNRQIRVSRALEERLFLSERQRDSIGQFAEELKSAISDCERTIATWQARSMASGIASLERLRSASRAEIDTCLLEAMEDWLGKATWTVFIVENDGLIPFCTSTETDSGSDTSAAALLKATVLHPGISKLDRALSVFEEADAAILDQFGIFACCIRADDRSPSMGLLVVKSVQVVRLRPEAPGAVVVLARALGEALARIRHRRSNDHDKTHDSASERGQHALIHSPSTEEETVSWIQ